MKHFLIASLAAVTLAACGNAADTSTAVKDVATTGASKVDAMMDTKTKAVLVYADWCGSCKILDPALKKAQALGAIPGVEFVVLDYTEKNDADFYAQAEAAGVETAVRTYLDGTVKTGQLLLVDLDDEKVISKVTKTDAVPAIVAKIKDAVSAS